MCKNINCEHITGFYYMDIGHNYTALLEICEKCDRLLDFKIKKRDYFSEEENNILSAANKLELDKEYTLDDLANKLLARKYAFNSKDSSLYK